MAYETKALLIALSRIATLEGDRGTYAAIAQMANSEGVILKSFDEAKKEIEEEKRAREEALELRRKVAMSK